MNNKSNRQMLHKANTILWIFILSFICIILGNGLINFLLTSNKSDEVIKDKVCSLTSTLTTQMKLNLNRYTSNLESTSTLIFANEAVYHYDATQPQDNEYDAIETETSISNTLFNICVMENYVDFGIVYRNNHTVGKISNGTMLLYGNELFSDMYDTIKTEPKKCGWFAGYHGDYTRIYYAKVIHDNAIMVSSFYTSELKQVFENPNDDINLTIRLLGKDYIILYSPNPKEIGTVLPSYFTKELKNDASQTVFDRDYLVSTTQADNYFTLISTTPSKDILKDMQKAHLYFILVSIVGIILEIIICLILFHQISKPLKNIVRTLDERAKTDSLTNLLNKASFEQAVSMRLESSLPTNKYAYLILDIDNFKNVNDTLGHAIGDEVIQSLSEILTQTFSKQDYIGRIGGDEFCCLLVVAKENHDQAYSYVEQKCEELANNVSTYFTDAQFQIPITISIGVSLYGIDGTTFQELYKNADNALYDAKQHGKNTYEFYRTAKEENE